MKILYGCCYKADLNIDDVDYVDVIPGLLKSHNCNYICTSIENIKFTDYDVIICSPPCNYYCRHNWHRETSNYSLSTRHLLPFCINEAYKSGKPFIIENVRNMPMFKKLDIPKDIYIYTYGRHTYFTNVLLDLSGINQISEDIQNISSNKRQGGSNVNDVFLWFLSVVTNKDYYL